MKRLVLVIAVLVMACGSNSSGPEDPQPYLPHGMSFVDIPSGSYVMGSPEWEIGSRDDERPQHEVTIGYDFEIMTTEVTQGMWREVMGTMPAWGCGEGDTYPVYYVSWDECQMFTEKLNLLDSEHLYRLPSEAEWEYACRAGTTSRFYWGNDEEAIVYYAWCASNSDGQTHPVGLKLPNAWGLYDMNGNVNEWCLDWYHDSYNGAPSDGSAWDDSPSLPYRIERGGNWTDSPPIYLRSAYRAGDIPESQRDLLGFRIVRIDNP